MSGLLRNIQVAFEFKQHIDGMEEKPQNLVEVANEFKNFVQENYPNDKQLNQLAQKGVALAQNPPQGLDNLCPSNSNNDNKDDADEFIELLMKLIEKLLEIIFGTELNLTNSSQRVNMNGLSSMAIASNNEGLSLSGLSSSGDSSNFDNLSFDSVSSDESNPYFLSSMESFDSESRYSFNR